MKQSFRGISIQQMMFTMSGSCGDLLFSYSYPLSKKQNCQILQYFQTGHYNFILFIRIIKPSILQYQLVMGNSSSGKSKQGQSFEYHKKLFFFIATIGKGAFGWVQKVKFRNGKEKGVFALKTMSKVKILAKNSVQSILNQRLILQHINSSFVIKMEAAFQDHQNLYLLLQYLSGGDLRYYINRNVHFSQNQIKFIARCILQGLRSIHNCNIVHRDIKPENIVFDETGYCKIIDLGMAQQWRMNNAKDTGGTPGYIAPEALLGQNYSFCVDYFALGVICYQLMMGYRPYKNALKGFLKQSELPKQVEIPESCSKFSKDMIDFTNHLIKINPEDRLGYGGITELLDHPWIKMAGEEQIEFRHQKAKSAFIPCKTKNYDNIHIDSKPSQAQKQNIPLLEKEITQERFKDFYYNRSSHAFNDRQSTNASDSRSRKTSWNSETTQV